MANNEQKRKKHSCSFLLVFYWAKFLGINIFKLSKNNRLERSYGSIIYVICLVMVYAYVIYRVVFVRMKLEVAGETPLSFMMSFVDLTLEVMEVLLRCSQVLIYQNRVKYIVNSLHNVNQVFKRLRVEEDYEILYFRLAITLTIFNGVCIFRNTSSFLLTAYGDGDLVVWLSYALVTLIPLNTGFVFVWIVTIVRRKFQRLNEKIRNLVDISAPGSRSNSRSERSLGIDGNSSYTLCQQVEIISRLHRELRNVVQLVEEHFALFLLINSLINLLSITSSIHVTYRHLKHRQQFTWDDLVFVLHNSLWIMSPIIVLTIVSNICGSMAKEANDTGNFLLAMLNNCQTSCNVQTSPALLIFSLDLLQNKVKFSLLGLVEVDYFLVYNMTATAVSYLTIMLQFYD